MDFSTNPPIPVLLNPLLQEYNRRLEQDSPGLVRAFYLVGSLALDAFNPRLSDIDFVAVLSRPSLPDDLAKLLEIHRGVERHFPKWKMEGDYLPAAAIGCLDDEVGPFLNYHDGKLAWRQRLGLSSVTWWILKEKGIAVFGPLSQELALTVDMERLLQGQRENLNSYWASWTSRPVRLAGLLTDWGVQWTILGVLRQFYTLRERQIVSKTEAGKYAMACLPQRWEPIIAEAIALRETPPRSHYPSRILRAVETHGFLKYIIQVCNHSLEASDL
jgi:hypothetical protein